MDLENSKLSIVFYLETKSPSKSKEIPKFDSERKTNVNMISMEDE